MALRSLMSATVAESPAAIPFERVQPDLDRHCRSVFAAPLQVATDAHRPGFRGLQKSRSQFRMSVTQLLRQKYVDRLPQELAVQIAELLLNSPVDQLNKASFIHGDHAGRFGVEDETGVVGLPPQPIDRPVEETDEFDLHEGNDPEQGKWHQGGRRERPGVG